MTDNRQRNKEWLNNFMDVTCQQCKGKGYYTVRLRQSKSTPYRFARNDGCLVTHVVACDVPGCHNGKVNLEEQHKILWGN